MPKSGASPLLAEQAMEILSDYLVKMIWTGKRVYFSLEILPSQ